MKKILKWFIMLNKRLYKKAAFVAILVLIPLSILALGIIAKQDGGFLHIILVQTDNADPVSAEIVNELLTEDSMIYFSEVFDEKSAYMAVKTGDADAAWIFPKDMQTGIAEFSSVNSSKDSIIRIIEKEDSVFLKLSHEKLSGALYKHTAKAYYLDFVRTNISELDFLSDEKLIEYFNNTNISEELFVFDSPTTSDTQKTTYTSDYLTSPIRGLLSVVVVLSAMAGALFYIQDEKSGTFSWVKEASKIYVAFSCILIAVINVGAATLIALYAAGLATTLVNEVLSIILYSVCCSFFALILKNLLKNIKLYAGTIPLLIVIMIVICPVFVDFRSISIIQHLFPPTYYINAAHNNSYVLYMLVYSLVCALLCFALPKVNRIKK